VRVSSLLTMRRIRSSERALRRSSHQTTQLLHAAEADYSIGGWRFGSTYDIVTSSEVQEMNASMYRQQEARNSSIRTGTHQVGTGLLRSIAQYHRQAWAFKYNGASFQRQRVTARPVFFFLLELRIRSQFHYGHQ
jgi:hypothetical protein